MKNGKKILITAIGFIVLCVAIFGILFLSQDVADGASYSADVPSDTTSTVSPSASPTPIPPASAATVSTALKQRSRAKAACGEWNRARKAFTLRLVPFSKNSAARPARSEPEAVWLAAGKSWRNDTFEYKHKFNTLRDKMVSTRGGGALRWRPLIRWWWPEWNESQVYLMVHIIWHESAGRYHANIGTSLAYGLFQHLPNPGPLGVWAQAKLARWKYDAMGHNLSPWNGCRAFSCPGGCGIY